MLTIIGVSLLVATLIGILVSAAHQWRMPLDQATFLVIRWIWPLPVALIAMVVALFLAALLATDEDENMTNSDSSTGTGTGEDAGESWAGKKRGKQDFSA